MHRYAFAPALLALSGLLLASAPAVAADIDKNKLVGTWIQGNGDKACHFQFTSDGKYIRKYTSDGGKTFFERDEGPNIVKGNKLIIYLSKDPRNGIVRTTTYTITELTDKKLVLNRLTYTRQ